MKNPIAKLARNNHSNLIISRLPAITFMYGLQCYLIFEFAKQVNIANYAMYLGIFLISFVSALFAYDKYHHVLIFKDRVHINFQLFGTAKEIHFSDIKEIIVPDKECDFSSILIKTKDDESHTIHFIDYPVQVKKFISELTHGQDTVESEDFDQAA